MISTLIAKDALTFLISWEIMSLSSFMLVLYEKEHAEIRKAGWIYLVSTHIGTAFIIAFFFLIDSGGFIFKVLTCFNS